MNVGHQPAQGEARQRGLKRKTLNLDNLKLVKGRSGQRDRHPPRSASFALVFPYVPSFPSGRYDRRLPRQARYLRRDHIRHGQYH